MISERRETVASYPSAIHEASEAVPMDTVLFTDHDVLIFAMIASGISLMLAVLFSATAEHHVERLESKIRQVIIHP
jgi:hypothetical protein